MVTAAQGTGMTKSTATARSRTRQGTKSLYGKIGQAIDEAIGLGEGLAGMVDQNGNRTGAGGLGGQNPGGGVFDHDAPTGRKAQTLSGELEHLGIGLAPCHIVGTDHH